MNLYLSDIFVGLTDAKNELLRGCSSDKDAFLSGFLIPENVSLNEFYRGRRYYVTGLKGTGKTALLRYLSMKVEEEQQASTLFILFKSEFTEEDRAKLSHTADIFSKSSDFSSQFKDYERVWIWFLFQRIVKICEERGVQLYEDNADWKQFRRKVLAAMDSSNQMASIFPKVKQGKIEVSTKLLTVHIDFEPSEETSKERAKIDFVSLVSQCEELFKKLRPSRDKLYLFIDELELSLGAKKKYQRDIELIRDMILAVYKLNSLSRENQTGLYCIAALRREVHSATMSAGKEINKPVSDFGITLRWHQARDYTTDHPLIKIILQRLRYAELSLPEADRAHDDESLWLRYFPEKINEKTSQEFILNRTWFRPRDIVRLLSIAQQQFPSENKFSQRILENVNKEFSTESWTEQVEELQTRYSLSEIDGIKHIVMGLRCPFILSDIIRKADQTKQLYQEVDNLLSNHKLGSILEDLYSLGIIGNTGEKNMRYAFRGDDGLLLENPMTIHPALWNVLSASRANAGY